MPQGARGAASEARGVDSTLELGSQRSVGMTGFQRAEAGVDVTTRTGARPSGGQGAWACRVLC